MSDTAMHLAASWPHERDASTERKAQFWADLDSGKAELPVPRPPISEMEYFPCLPSCHRCQLEAWAKQMDNVVDENRQTDDWGVQIVDVDIIRRDILGTLEAE